MARPQHTSGWRNSARQQGKRKKRQITLTVIGALILVLTYTCKEFLIDECKELSDSLQAAQSAVDTQLNQTSISDQIMTLSQQTQLYHAKEIANSPGLLSADILQNSAMARQTLANLNADFDSVSKLVDKLAFVDVDHSLRRTRDQVRAQVDKVNANVNAGLASSTEQGMARLRRVVFAAVEPLIISLSVIVLQDFAVAMATRTQEWIAKIRRILTYLSYFLYVVGVSLAAYATLSGSKAIEE